MHKHENSGLADIGNQTKVNVVEIQVTCRVNGVLQVSELCSVTGRATDAVLVALSAAHVISEFNHKLRAEEVIARL